MEREGHLEVLKVTQMSHIPLNLPSPSLRRMEARINGGLLYWGVRGLSHKPTKVFKDQAGGPSPLKKGE